MRVGARVRACVRVGGRAGVGGHPSRSRCVRSTRPLPLSLAHYSPFAHVTPPPPTHTFLQACSILYKTRLPLLLVFNKVDVARHDFALEWLRDFEAFGAALDGESSYAASLSRSMSLVLDSFYQNMRAVGVSAVTGARAWGWG